VSGIDLDSTENAVLRHSRVIAPFSPPELIERATGVFLFLAASPVIAASAIAAAALSRRSPFIAHLRVAKNGEPFWMLKLRTMWPASGSPRGEWGWMERIVADPGDEEKNASDPRVTSRFAAFCRRYSIDELPQLWHVALGDMSLVGPRPLTRSEIERHYGAAAPEILAVKPGLTGLWQIHGRSAIRFPLRAAMDLELVRSLTASTYFRILARTIPAVLRGSGAW
jgi:exopolysaccharide production protein ExoY